MAKQKLGPQPLLYPLPVVVVGADVSGKPNFMTVSWCGIASYSPPAVTIGLQTERHTLKGVLENNTFSVNVMSVDMLREVDYCGVHSGKKVDKSGVFDFFYGSLKTAPIINKAPVNLECKVVDSRNLGSHVLIIGEIVETYMDSECITNGKPDIQKIKPIMFSIGSMMYHGVGDEIGEAYKIGK